MGDCVFGQIEMAKPIEVFQLSAKYNECKAEQKINLGVGAYRTDEGKPWVLPVVRKAETLMAEDETLNHEYLPVAGLPDFRQAATKLLLSEGNKAFQDGRAIGFQAPGGTGALRLGAAFLHNVLGFDTVYVSNPTWGNHKGVFSGSGFSSVKEYRYFDSSNCSLDLNGMLEDLNSAPPRSVVVLHAVAHNPTGIDPTTEQWEEIYKVIVAKGIFVVMDCAYQGFASGDLDRDAAATRFFVDKNMDMLIAQSFSKNFGLYNERTGNLIVVSKDVKKIPEIRSQMEIQIRILWSNPPNHGARIVACVLNHEGLHKEWVENVKTMAERIKKMRLALLNKLKDLGTPGNWSHITSQIGMFSYTGLTPKQVDMLQKDFNIFLLSSGRISMCGLTTKNVDYMAQAMDKVVRTCPSN